MEGALVQSGFKVADAFFHGAIVAWVSRWIVERQYPISGQHLINFAAVEGRAVVALEEQGRAVLFESGFEEGGDLRAVLGGTDDGIDAVARGQVVERDDFPAVICGGVGGPGEVGPEPVDAFHGLKLVLSELPGERLDPTAGDALREEAMQIAGAAGARPALGELLEPAEELRAQGLALFRPGRAHRRLALAQPPLPAHEGGVRELGAQFAPAQVELLVSLRQFGNHRRDHLEFFFVAEPRTDRGSAMALIIWRSFSFC